jgi:Protein of unknown function (DUF4230)
VSKNQAWVLVIGILAIGLLFVAGTFLLIQSTMQRTFEPVESMTGNLSTRVSEILNPTPTILPSPISILREVRNLSRLETIQFSIERVITAESGHGVFGPLLGDRLLFVGHGDVIAGVDLAKLGPDDLNTSEGVLYVHLPEAEIFSASLDNEKSYIYNRETGLFTKGDINLETNARRAAEVEIQKAALEDGILEVARQNAETYLYGMFRELGFSEIIFIPPTPSTPQPG